MTALPRDLTRIILAVLAIGAMILFSLWIVKPFLPATIWAMAIVIATWPILRAVQKRLWGRRWMAVLVMTLAMLLIFIVPFTFVLRTIVHHEHEITEWTKTVAAYRFSAPPAWVAKLPMVGATAVSEWTNLSHEGAAELESVLTAHSGQLMSWFVSEVGAMGLITGQFLLTLAISAVLYATGERAAQGVRLFLRRLGGHHGDVVMELVGRAIRGVILGTIVAGILIAILSGAGLVIARVPAAVLLTAIMFLLYLVQIGTTPVLGIAIIWLYATGHTGAGTFLLIWTVVIVAADSVLRPLLMKRGAELPLPLIFTGVVGGMAAFGLVGIFIGPITLAVTYTLLEAWVRNADAESPIADDAVLQTPLKSEGNISGA
ncbi:MAG: AI-2E family transporter YdiK [Chthoniobacteraceae bacterium]